MGFSKMQLYARPQLWCVSILILKSNIVLIALDYFSINDAYILNLDQLILRMFYKALNEALPIEVGYRRGFVGRHWYIQ